MTTTPTSHDCGCPHTPSRPACVTPHSKYHPGGGIWGKLGYPRFAIAPMVDASELAYRLLCSQYGTHLGFTPMINANMYCRSEMYRKDVHLYIIGNSLVVPAPLLPLTRPLVVQIAGDVKENLLETARGVSPYCDMVDINFGCPQDIAKRGGYGAYLLEKYELVESIVSYLCDPINGLSVPVSCKIRLLPLTGAGTAQSNGTSTPSNTAQRNRTSWCISSTVRLVKMLQRCGVAMLTVHGRTRHQKGALTGSPDWSGIKAVVEAVDLPVFANGGINSLTEAEQCLRDTGAVGVMSAEGLLANPALFHHSSSIIHHPSLISSSNNNGATTTIHNTVYVDPLHMAKQYLEICQALYQCNSFPWQAAYTTLTPTHLPSKSPVSMSRSHLYRLLHPFFSVFLQSRNRLGDLGSIEEQSALVDEVSGMVDRYLGIVGGRKQVTHGEEGVTKQVSSDQECVTKQVTPPDLSSFCVCKQLSCNCMDPAVTLPSRWLHLLGRHSWYYRYNKGERVTPNTAVTVLLSNNVLWEAGGDSSDTVTCLDSLFTF